MDQTDNIAAFEIPADGQDRLIIGDFDFKLIEDACNWGTGGLVNISACLLYTSPSPRDS